MKRNLLVSIAGLCLVVCFLLPLVLASNKESSEIKEATIVNAYWAGDYQVPDISPRRNNSFMLEIQFPMDNPKPEQIHNFLVKAGYQFQLKAKGEKTLNVLGYECGYYQLSNKNIWGYWFFIDSKEPVSIRTDIPYQLTLKKPNKDYRWMIKGKITFRNLNDVQFSTYKDPGSEILTHGKPWGSMVTATIPFSNTGGLVIVKTRINHSDKEYRFAVDTGAGPIVIDNKLANELGLVKKAEGKVADYFDTKSVSIVSLDRLTVGETGVENCGAVVMSLQVLGGYRVDGLIGYDFLKFFNVKLDYPQQKLTLSRENIPSAPSSYEIKLHLKPNRQIATQLNIGGIGVEATIDSGALGDYYLIIPIAFFDQNPSRFGCKPLKIKGIAAQGPVSQSEGMVSRINSIQLGDFQVNNLPVICEQSDNFVLGSAFLSHFEVTINFPALEMNLVPIPSDKMSDNILAYGFGSQKDDAGKIHITGIIEGSPADLAGLKTGDEIEEIHNAENRELSYEESVNLIASGDNRQIKLFIRDRDGKREVVLNKALLLPDVK
ncbi:MAG TPA: aspartyl protease family protein [Bacillota bacterium]